jgi:RNA polymerase sigma-70 factor (ECF subfamily)
MVCRRRDGVFPSGEVKPVTNLRLPHDLERYRDYLRLLARMQIDPRLRRDCDPSDIVQTVMLKAHQNHADFRGDTSEKMGAWLRQILANTLADVLRDRLRDKRDIRREKDLEGALNESSLRLAACAASPDLSPSGALQAKEHALRLANALARLPELQREAVTLKHFEGRPLFEVANLMDRSPASVASLLRRGLAKLRELLAEDSRHDP